MKSLKNETYEQANGELVKDDKSKALTTREFIKIILSNSRYETTADQMTGFAIVNKIDEKLKLEGEKDNQFIKMEDADFTLIKKLTEKYEPIKQGLTFSPFLKALEIAAQ